MDSIAEKTSASPRVLLFGILANCLFPTRTDEDCPLWELRNSLSIEKKHEYAKELSDKEVKNILVQHERCFEKRLSDLNQL